jgi:hypothetical protein
MLLLLLSSVPPCTCCPWDFESAHTLALFPPGAQPAGPCHNDATRSPGMLTCGTGQFHSDTQSCTNWPPAHCATGSALSAAACCALHKPKAATAVLTPLAVASCCGDCHYSLEGRGNLSSSSKGHQHVGGCCSSQTSGQLQGDWAALLLGTEDERGNQYKQQAASRTRSQTSAHGAVTEQLRQQQSKVPGSCVDCISSAACSRSEQRARYLSGHPCCTQACAMLAPCMIHRLQGCLLQHTRLHCCLN